MDPRTRKLIVMHQALYIPEMTQTVCKCQGKNEEEVLLAFKTASVYQYNDSKIT